MEFSYEEIKLTARKLKAGLKNTSSKTESNVDIFFQIQAKSISRINV